MKFLGLIAAVGALAFSASSALANVTVLSDMASWNAAVAVSTSVMIPNSTEDLGRGTTFAGYDDGVIYATDENLSDGYQFRVGTEYGGSVPVQSSQKQTFGVPNLTVILDDMVTAFSLDYSTFYGGQVSFELSNGHTVKLGSTYHGYYTAPDFFGIIDDTPFDSVRVIASLDGSADEILSIANVTFGPAYATSAPEPAIWLMLVGGFGGVGAALRNRRFRSAAA